MVRLTPPPSIRVALLRASWRNLRRSTPDPGVLFLLAKLSFLYVLPNTPSGHLTAPPLEPVSRIANNARHRRITSYRETMQASHRHRALLLIALLCYAPMSHAYLDPGTGSMILSAIVGLIATLTLTAKTWWYRLKRLFSRRDRETAAPPKGDEKPSSSTDS